MSQGSKLTFEVGLGFNIPHKFTPGTQNVLVSVVSTTRKVLPGSIQEKSKLLKSQSLQNSGCHNKII